MESTSYTFPVQTGGIFYFPWHRHQIERPTAFSVSSERHRDKQSLMLRARFLHLIMSHAWAGNRTRVGGVTGERIVPKWLSSETSGARFGDFRLREILKNAVNLDIRRHTNDRFDFMAFSRP